MKIRLFDKVVPVPEKEIILKMFRRYNTDTRKDEIVVAIVNEEGNVVHRGQLIAFSSDMYLIRRNCVTEEYDLPLSNSRLAEEDD